MVYNYIIISYKPISCYSIFEVNIECTISHNVKIPAYLIGLKFLIIVM